MAVFRRFAEFVSTVLGLVAKCLGVLGVPFQSQSQSQAQARSRVQECPAGEAVAGPEEGVGWAPPGRVPGKRALPPTMPQRIRAEAHGSAPSCRRLAGDGGLVEFQSRSDADELTARKAALRRGGENASGMDSRFLSGHTPVAA